jgi:VIT1/CCC1 family predicted Fe2+/Mn2+ transporter
LSETSAKLDAQTQQTILAAQRNELTEHLIYQRLARATRDPHNREVLARIAEDELRHARFWRRYTQRDIAPNRLKAAWYVLLAKLLGLTFSIKLMERGEELAQVVYNRIAVFVPQAQAIVQDEDHHEAQLIDMLDEERLRYVGSMVLGLNDALVELTGTLAGLTLALQNTRLIGMAGLITGIAASLSMASSEYLSTKSEGSAQDPLKASLYTGVAYVFTVVLLILPYFLLSSYLAALGLTVAAAVLIILAFTFYTSVAKDLPFGKRFAEMASLSLVVATLSFGIGFLVREFLHIDV